MGSVWPVDNFFPLFPFLSKQEKEKKEREKREKEEEKRPGREMFSFGTPKKYKWETERIEIPENDSDLKVSESRRGKETHEKDPNPENVADLKKDQVPVKDSNTNTTCVPRIGLETSEEDTDAYPSKKKVVRKGPNMPKTVVCSNTKNVRSEMPVNDSDTCANPSTSDAQQRMSEKYPDDCTEMNELVTHVKTLSVTDRDPDPKKIKISEKDTDPKYDRDPQKDPNTNTTCVPRKELETSKEDRRKRKKDPNSEKIQITENYLSPKRIKIIKKDTDSKKSLGQNERLSKKEKEKEESLGPMFFFGTPIEYKPVVPKENSTILIFPPKEPLNSLDPEKNPDYERIWIPENDSDPKDSESGKGKEMSDPGRFVTPVKTLTVTGKNCVSSECYPEYAPGIKDIKDSDRQCVEELKGKLEKEIETIRNIRSKDKEIDFYQEGLGLKEYINSVEKKLEDEYAKFMSSNLHKKKKKNQTCRLLDVCKHKCCKCRVPVKDTDGVPGEDASGVPNEDASGSAPGKDAPDGVPGEDASGHGGTLGVVPRSARGTH